MNKYRLFSKLLTAITISILLLGNSRIGFCNTPTPDCPSDLLLLLRLNESTGPTYADFYGLHNATASVSPTATPGKINGAQFFDDNTYFNIPQIAGEFDWGIGASFSMECWIKTSEAKKQAIISRFNLDPGTYANWWLGINENGYATMELTDNWNHTSGSEGFTNLADNQWHYIVGVRNGATDHDKIYVDGVEVSDKSVGLSQDFIFPLTTDITFGYMLRNPDDPEYHYTGSLDEIGLYSRALTASEITSFYNSGSPKKHCNYSPVITSTAITTGIEDAVYTYNFTVNDVDVPDVLTLSAVTKPSWSTFTWTPGQKTAVLSGTPTNDNTGSSNVTLRVNDGYTNTDQIFTINVAQVNDVPVITGQNTLSVDEDHSITLLKADLLITDVDNPAADLTIQVIAGTNYSLVGNVITPALNFNGQLSVNTVAKDLVGQSEVYPVVITVNSINDAPVVTSSAILTANVNSVYLYQMTVEDADAVDILTVTAPNKPSWLSFTPSSNGGILMGIPTAADEGTYPVILKVNDGHVDVLQGFAIQVSGPIGIKDIKNSEVNLVYPNPANDKIFYKFEETGSYKFEILDLTGKLQKEVNIENENLIEINISDISKGIYIYKAYQNGKIVIGMFTKN
jgi:hypothetical protein